MGDETQPAGPPSLDDVAGRIAGERWPGQIASVRRAADEDAYLVELVDGTLHVLRGEEVAAAREVPVVGGA